MNPKAKIEDSTLVRAKLVDQLCDEFESECRSGNRPSIESFLERVEVSQRALILPELIGVEIHYRCKRGESYGFEDYRSRFPDLSAEFFSEIVQKVLQSPSDNCDRTLEQKCDDDLNAILPHLQASSRPGWLGRLSHFDIERVLGKGAFGIVVKAFDERLHRVVAIKFMSPELAVTSPPRKRFLREARAAAAVRHENIVAIHAIEEDPFPYIVMEYIPGITLQQWLDRNGPLDLPEFLQLAPQIAAGLSAAHQAKLIHRDIKPSNILLEAGIEKRVKISDFGLARTIDDASQTSSGIIAGTPMYMAPEQARGEVLDHRADLFSLGSVFYQMVSGRPPFRAANTVATLKRVCEDTPRPLPDVIPETPRWLCSIIGRLLAKKPADRYQDAGEVAKLLIQARSQQVACDAVDDETAISTGATNRPEEAWSNSTSLANRNVDQLKSPPFATGLLNHRGWLLIVVVSMFGMLLYFGLRFGFDFARQETPSEAITNSVQSPHNGKEPKEAENAYAWDINAPAPAISPFRSELARNHQDEWASHFKIPIAYTNSIGMKFVLIPPGEFTMGSSADVVEGALQFMGNSPAWQEAMWSETPPRKVIITRAFYLGVTEVTQAEYEKVMGDNPSYFSQTGAGKDAVPSLDTANHPVESVTWLNAIEFCRKLSETEDRKPYYNADASSTAHSRGTGYRLPTEAEWELACKAGSDSKYWFGDDHSKLVHTDWFNKNSESHTHAVAQREPNPFGLYDTQGNVAEWAYDEWQPLSQFEPGLAIDPAGPVTGNRRRTVRGGCFAYNSTASRATIRCPIDVQSKMLALGFRVALEIDDRLSGPK